MLQLQSQDAGFLHLESASVKTHFTMITIYDQSTVPGGKLRYRDILAYFDRVMGAMPVFRRKLLRIPLSLDTPYLVDDPNYHLESHIRHIALPAPADWRQFCILAAQIQAAPMDMSKPLWDMHVIEGLHHIEGLAPDSFAILTRLHHAIADGATVRGLLMALHMPEGSQYKPPEAPPGPEPSLTAKQLAKRALANNLRQGLPWGRVMVRKLPVVGELIGRRVLDLFAADDKHDLEHADADVPITLFNQELTYHRVFQAVSLPLKDMMELRHKVENATVNDVVMALIGTAMHLYLQREKAAPEASLYAVCPVNLRQDKLKDSTLGNNISMMRACLHTDEADPLARLRAIVAETAASKKIQQASSVKELMALSRNVPSVFLAAASRLALPLAVRYTRTHALANAVISNVPGPQVPLYFLGAKMTLLTGIGPLVPGMGLTFGVLSYDGRMTISFVGCPAWVRDPQALADCLRESLRWLQAADPAAPVPAKRKRRAVNAP